MNRNVLCLHLSQGNECREKNVGTILCSYKVPVPKKIKPFFFFFLVSSYSYHIFNICPSLFLTSPTPSKTHRFSQYQQVLVFFLWHLSDSSASHHSSTTSLFYAAVISCLGCATSSFLGPMFFCLCPFNLLSSKVNKLSENITWPYHSSA